MNQSVGFGINKRKIFALIRVHIRLIDANQFQLLKKEKIVCHTVEQMDFPIDFCIKRVLSGVFIQDCSSRTDEILKDIFLMKWNPLSWMIPMNVCYVSNSQYIWRPKSVTLDFSLAKLPVKNDINPPTAIFGIYRFEISRSQVLISLLPIYHSPITQLQTINNIFSFFLSFSFEKSESLILKTCVFIYHI